MGGLARRATVINKLVKENPNVIIVDSGNQSDKPGRLDLIMSILAEMKYDAIGIGKADRQFEKEFFEAAFKHSIPVVDAATWSANFSTKISKDKPKWQAVPYVVKKVSAVNVGIISFGAPQESAAESERSNNATILSALKEVRAKCDLVIALDQAGLATREWIQERARETCVPDVVIGGSARAQSPPVEVIDGCHVVQTSLNGSHVGVIDVEFEVGQPPRFTFDRIALDASVPEEPSVKRRVSQFLDSIGQRSAALDSVGAGSTVSGGYLHPRMCRGCHEEQYEDWTTTKHAQALKTLEVNKRLIPECLDCHSEAYRKTGTVSVSLNGIGGVECITCHRLPVPHWDEKRAPAGTWKVDPKLCTDCHTAERSPAYNASTYLPKVSHGVIPMPKPSPIKQQDKRRLR